MKLGSRITQGCVKHHKAVALAVIGITLLIALAAGLPSLGRIDGMPGWVRGLSTSLSFLHTVEVDTDPENMLSESEPVRVFHDAMKRKLNLHDMVVIGVVNEQHAEGVFNPRTLAKVYSIAEFAKLMQFDPRGRLLTTDRKEDGRQEEGWRPLGDGLEVRIDRGGELHFRKASGEAAAAPGPSQQAAGPELPGGLGGEDSDGGPALPGGLGGEDGPALPGGLGGGEPEPKPAAPQEDAEKPAEYSGVIERDIIAPSTVDKIEPGSPVRFSWLMRHPPEDAATAVAVREAAQRVAFLNGTVVSEDGKMVAVYVPLTAKDLSHSVYTSMQRLFDQFDGPEQYHVTGLPVAEDTFGVEMFIQMAISAPAAMGVIFVLMLLFFRKLLVVISPMIVALVSVILTMGALVIAGFPIHIMSSMIPIFIMPIAVLDSIHIISEFFEKYQATKDRGRTMRDVMDELFAPMLYTSLTSAAGFASLALTPIPPVQVFGVFVAGGIMVAWLLTVTFIPAFVMFIPPKALENFGAKHEAGEPVHETALTRALKWMGGATYRRAKPILALSAVVLVVAGWGISRININDNPIKWFTPSHPIREADRVLNEHFGGTYMAYLALEAEPNAMAAAMVQPARPGALEAMTDKIGGNLLEPNGLAELVDEVAASQPTTGAAKRRVLVMVDNSMSMSLKDEKADEELPRLNEERLRLLKERGADVILISDGQPNEPNAIAQKITAPVLSVDLQPGESVAPTRSPEVFKDPAVLKWMVGLQEALERTAVVGKSNSLADIVRTVHRDLLAEDLADPNMQSYYRVPDTRASVAECLIQFQSGHRPHDLWHFVTPDYRTTSLWVQLTSGDNKDMSKVVRRVDEYIAANPPPVGIRHRWFGLTYINVVWQEKMVSGMLQAFAGSFVIVFLLMAILFRSALWGLLSMIPLTVTIAAIYGAVGIIGKDYDMPVAVLSSLTLGLAVDFAIHFLARAREMRREYGTWEKTAPAVFGEPARAITRNIIVIAAGFLPLLLAPLVPYKTVGVLLATILLVSGVGTLLILPALIRVLQKHLFAEKKAMGPACNCVLCIATATAAAVLVALTLYQSYRWGWMTWLALGIIPLATLACGILSRRRQCRVGEEDSRTETSEQTENNR